MNLSLPKSLVATFNLNHTYKAGIHRAMRAGLATRTLLLLALWMLFNRFLLVSALDFKQCASNIIDFHEVAPTAYSAEDAFNAGLRAMQIVRPGHSIKKESWVMRHELNDESVPRMWRFAPMLTKDLQLQAIRQPDGSAIANMDVVMFQQLSHQFSPAVPASILRPKLIRVNARSTAIRMDTVYRFSLGERMTLLKAHFESFRKSHVPPPPSPASFYASEIDRIKRGNRQQGAPLEQETADANSAANHGIERSNSSPNNIVEYDFFNIAENAEKRLRSK